MGRHVHFSISLLLVVISLCNSEPPPIQYSTYSNYEPSPQYTPKYSYRSSASGSSTGDIYGSPVGDLGEGGYASSGDDYGHLQSKPRPSSPKYTRYMRPLMAGYRIPSWTIGMPMKMLHGKSNYLYRPTYRRYRPNHFGPPPPPPTPRYAYPSENYHRPTYGSSSKGQSYSESPSYAPEKHTYTETSSHSYLPPIYETSSGSGSTGGSGTSGSSSGSKSPSSSRYSSKPILPYSKYPSGSYSKDTESHNYYTNTPASIAGYRKKTYHSSLTPPVSYSTVRPADEDSPYASYDGAGMLASTGNEYGGPSGGAPIEEQLGSYDAQERYKGA